MLLLCPLLLVLSRIVTVTSMHMCIFRSLVGPSSGLLGAAAHKQQQLLVAGPGQLLPFELPGQRDNDASHDDLGLPPCGGGVAPLGAHSAWRDARATTLQCGRAGWLSVHRQGPFFARRGYYQQTRGDELHGLVVCGRYSSKACRGDCDDDRQTWGNELPGLVVRSLGGLSCYELLRAFTSAISPGRA
jgi:hypothetical protein